MKAFLLLILMLALNGVLLYVLRHFLRAYERTILDRLCKAAAADVERLIQDAGLFLKYAQKRIIGHEARACLPYVLVLSLSSFFIAELTAAVFGPANGNEREIFFFMLVSFAPFLLLLNAYSIARLFERLSFQSPCYAAYLSNYQQLAGVTRNYELLPYFRGKRELPRYIHTKDLEEVCAYYCLFDLKEARYAFSTDTAIEDLRAAQPRTERAIRRGRCVYVREVIGAIEVQNSLRYDPSEQIVDLQVWNAAANELDRDRLRNVQKVVVDAPRADFPFDWAVAALLEAVETENLQIELEILHPERLGENTKRLLKDAGRLPEPSAQDLLNK